MAKVDKSELEKISQMLELMVTDTSIPRNVRTNLQDAQHKLKDNTDTDLAIGSVIYTLDEVSSDINLPMHARTMIWNLMSELESMKG
ncbi:MAG TPA: UPF0147 family protein [Candidatus Norongarragalinales archaeon]|nr:UPF0147 family protein [Candidatus Norongarragalinales archaeon]